MADLLEPVGGILFRNSGSIHEGDVFSILASSPFVVRSGEFALMDGALDCTSRHESDSSYASRYWEVNDRAADPSEAGDLAGFEVKSCAFGEAGKQIYITTIAQRRRAAFYIAKLATDPNWVELIPNYQQDAESLDPESANLEAETAEHIINFTRKSFMPPRTYGAVDPSGSAYRMPLSVLPEAVRRARLCCSVPGYTYVNPWTDVPFTLWRPVAGRAIEWFRPRENSGIFTAHDAVMKILQDFNYGGGGDEAAATANTFEVDFVGVQPCLGDFKIIVRGSLPRMLKGRISPKDVLPTTARHGLDPPTEPAVQYVIQHKIEGRTRSRSSKLTKVRVSRATGKAEKRKLRYFFNTFERFCFLFYIFEFASPEGRPPRQEFFFLPEKVIPNDLYLSQEEEADLEREEFKPYRFHMDEQGRWIDLIRGVIEGNPQPRRAGSRPCRDKVPDAEEDDSSVLQESIRRGPAKDRKGTAEYKEVLQNRQRLLYYSVMMECALRLSGVLVVLAPKHPYGDFAYARFKWTSQESDAFLESGRPPVTVDEMPPDACLVYLTYYSRYAESSFCGPNVTAAQFRRINSCKAYRLLLWDMAGFDTMERQMVPAIIPSEDLRPSELQRQRFERNQGVRNPQLMPSITGLLATGLYASEYTVGNGGPAVWDGAQWSEVWHLLDAFTKDQVVEHPAGMFREPSQYRHTVRAMNYRISEEHFRLQSDVQLHLKVAAMAEIDDDDEG